MKRANFVSSGKWLAVWWLVPLLLTLGLPGYWATALLILLFLCVFLIEPSRRGAIFLWMPLAAGSGIVCGGVLLLVLWFILMLVDASPNSAGPWAIGMVLMLVGPFFGVAVLLAVPILISTILCRPKDESKSLGVVALANTLLLFAVCQHVLQYDRGASYFATMPKLVKITHNPPLTAEEKGTARWLDALRAGGLDTEYQMPIDFYGIVTDEEGKPVEGVQVRYTLTPSKVGDHHNQVCNTGSDGRFEIRGQHGIGLFFLIGKEGYLSTGDINSTNYSFVDYEKPNFYVADPQHPEVIRLTHRPVIEPLSIWRGQIPYLKTKEKFYIDPETGRASTQSPSRAIWINISPELEDSSGGQQGIVSLGIDGGSIAPPTPNSKDYAPENGYTETWERSNIDSEFLTLAVYFKTASGKYGQLWIRGHAAVFQQRRPIDYEILLNPNGSRVLRYDGF